MKDESLPAGRQGRNVHLPFVCRLSEHWHSELIIMENSLYIHIPFCSKRCYYCDFYSAIYRKDLAAALVDVFCQQIESCDLAFDTVYIGGGTPTVLALDLLEKL
ncbi:MAG: hypothetical protein K9L61_05585, partial [Candidatus Omnitrophica bacterium]|nr:hypothetical protein [Candidatus Omnitrophota bacterium]